MCESPSCNNKIFYGQKCLRHYRYEKYGKCTLPGCHSPAMGKKGICDNCSRRGEPSRRHFGKHINTNFEKYCEGCKLILSRSKFYNDRGHSSYLCHDCHSLRRTEAKRRSSAYKFGVENVLQTSANLCVKCWCPLINWEVDHILPYSLGGGNEIENLQIMCRKCNRQKRNSENIDYREFIKQAVLLVN